MAAERRSRVLVVMALLAAQLLLVPAAGAAPKAPTQAVVALIDTGINPYSPAFRDRSPLAKMHPSKYIPGYPKSAEALKITLDVPYQVAMKRDAKLWESVDERTLYWIPGTRIIGAISFGAGGTYCPSVTELPVVNGELSTGCEEHKILDDQGHGSMTASRAAGAPRSLAPNARIVEIEGLGADQVLWAANQGWIDVNSNSWGSLVPHPAAAALPEPLFGTRIDSAFKYASTRMFTAVATGNGTGFVLGAAPNSSYLNTTMPPGIVNVGGHDNGHMTLWAGAPPHVVADAYAGYAATKGTIAPMKPTPWACCTSAPAPYASGGATAIVLAARKILNDHRTGIHKAVVARGKRGVVKRGPLADGVFTLDELKRVFFHTAEGRPAAGRDDGLLQWAGEPRAPDYTQYGPGANPFCVGCTTSQTTWSDAPADFDAFQFIGYGAINERSIKLANSVLSGKTALPDRATEDADYALDQTLRSLLFAAP